MSASNSAVRVDEDREESDVAPKTIPQSVRAGKGPAPRIA